MEAAVLARLARVCAVKTGADATPYCQDWLKQVVPQHHNAVAFPATTDQLRELLKICNDHKLPVVPQGGNTGLVQGSVPAPDVPSVVISTTKLNAIDVHAPTCSVACGAGAILSNVQKRCGDEGFMFPVDMGSKGSATVGGVVATNAGGIHYFRYGSVRANLLGLEAVLPNGEVLDWSSTLRKDNTGYDLKQLFVGSEGTLGIVTKCQFAIPRAYRSRAVLRWQVRDFPTVVELQAKLSSALGPALAAFEVLDREGLEAVGTGCLAPFVAISELHVYGANADPELAAAAVVAEDLGLSPDVADHGSACEAMMLEREHHPVKLAKLGPIFKYDLDSPLDQFYDVVEFARTLAAEREHGDEILVTGYGHFGDGNVHLNVVDRSAAARHASWIKCVFGPQIYEYTVQRRCSISAEHGIGREKRKYFEPNEPAPSLNMMKAIRRTFDPQGVMNPGVMFTL